VLHDDLVIVNASVESGAIVALSKADGKEAWRFEGIRRSWTTPLVATSADGREELIVSMEGKVLGLAPDSGEKLWECASVKDYVCPSVIAHGDVAYITGGRKPFCMALRLGGSGDVLTSHVLWQISKTPKVATPLYDDGRLHWIDQRGKAVCVDAASGNVLYEESLEIDGRGDKVYASLVLAGDQLYCVTRQSGTIVLKPGAEFKEITRNDVGDESTFNATPAIAGNRLLLRSDRFLYCIGEPCE
jgi:outer membrane protein assembly factor BamB